MPEATPPIIPLQYEATDAAQVSSCPRTTQLLLIAISIPNDTRATTTIAIRRKTSTPKRAFLFFRFYFLCSKDFPKRCISIFMVSPSVQLYTHPTTYEDMKSGSRYPLPLPRSHSSESSTHEQ